MLLRLRNAGDAAAAKQACGHAAMASGVRGAQRLRKAKGEEEKQTFLPLLLTSLVAAELRDDGERVAELRLPRPARASSRSEAVRRKRGCKGEAGKQFFQTAVSHRNSPKTSVIEHVSTPPPSMSSNSLQPVVSL